MPPSVRTASRHEAKPLPRAAILALGLAITGCVVGPNYHRPATRTPATFDDPNSILAHPSTQPSTQPSVTVESPLEIARWWASFNDPAMSSLIDRTITSNLDLRQAAAGRQGEGPARHCRGGAVSDGERRRDTAAAAAAVGGGIGTCSATVSTRRGRSMFLAGFAAASRLPAPTASGGRRPPRRAGDARRRGRRRLPPTPQLSAADRHRPGEPRRAAAERWARQGKSPRRHGHRPGRRQRRSQVATTASTIPALESLEQQTIYSLSLLLGQPPAALSEELPRPARSRRPRPVCRSGFRPTCSAAAPNPPLRTPARRRHRTHW